MKGIINASQDISLIQYKRTTGMAACADIMCTSTFGVICEEDNEHDKYAMAVHLNNYLAVVGHIPREITCTCHFFIKNKGEISGGVHER